MGFFLAACLLPSFLISCLATAGMRRIAPRLGLVDRPAARKVHVTPTPLGGGVAIWLGVMTPMAAAQLAAWWLTRDGVGTGWVRLPPEVALHLEGVLYRSWQMWAILAGGTLLAIMGLLDDLKNLPWPPRLLLQGLVSVGLVLGADVQATVFAPQSGIGQAISVVWLMVLINAFNFLDNMDGLSGGTALIAAVLFAAVMLTGTAEPRWLVGGALLVLAGALAGFLVHNWPPARIFMGDAGSYFIGLLLASLTLTGTFYDEASASRHMILAPLCILAVPLYDLCSVVFIRLAQRRSPFHPDKSHFSHRLVELGLRPRNAVLTIHLATLTTGLGGLLLYRVPGWTDAALVVGLIACVLAIVAVLESTGRRNGTP